MLTIQLNTPGVDGQKADKGPKFVALFEVVRACSRRHHGTLTVDHVTQNVTRAKSKGNQTAEVVL